jgi:hypothetical protein
MILQTVLRNFYNHDDEVSSNELDIEANAPPEAACADIQ